MTAKTVKLITCNQCGLEGDLEPFAGTLGKMMEIRATVQLQPKGHSKSILLHYHNGCAPAELIPLAVMFRENQADQEGRW